MIMNVTGPGLWIVSQLLLLLYSWLDNGANTCGIDFHFENKAAEKRDLDSINICGINLHFAKKQQEGENEC